MPVTKNVKLLLVAYCGNGKIYLRGYELLNV